MVLTSGDIYWITRLDSMNDTLGGFIVLLSVVIAVLFFIWMFSSIAGSDCGEDDDNNIRARKCIKPMIWLNIALVLVIVAKVFVPTTKEAAAMVVLPKIVNNEKVQQIPDKVLDLGLSWLEELKPKKDTNK